MRLPWEVFDLKQFSDEHIKAAQDNFIEVICKSLVKGDVNSYDQIVNLADYIFNKEQLDHFKSSPYELSLFLHNLDKWLDNTDQESQKIFRELYQCLNNFIKTWPLVDFKQFNRKDIILARDNFIEVISKFELNDKGDKISFDEVVRSAEIIFDIHCSTVIGYCRAGLEKSKTNPKELTLFQSYLDIWNYSTDQESKNTFIELYKWLSNLIKTLLSTT